MDDQDEFDIRKLAQRRQQRRAIQSTSSVDQLLQLTKPKHKKNNSTGSEFVIHKESVGAHRRGSRFETWNPLSELPIKSDRNKMAVVTSSQQPDRYLDNIPGVITDTDYSKNISENNVVAKSERKRFSVIETADRTIERNNSRNMIADTRRQSLSTSLVSSLPFEDANRVGRMQVPPIISCDCNGVEAGAIIDTSTSISLMSQSFAEKAKLTEDVIREITSIRNPFVPHGVGIIGRLKYLELYIGNNLYITQLYVVDQSIADITLGVDFLRKSQAVIDLDEGHVTFGGKQKKQKVPFLPNKQALIMSKVNGF